MFTTHRHENSGVMKQGLKLVALLLVTLQLCNCSAESWNRVANNVQRRFVPRPMREQLFTNTPTPWNQGRANEVEPEEVYRKLRNGTQDPREEYRMRSNQSMKNVAYSEDSYGRGFQDGCKTYMGVIGSDIYRLTTPRWDAQRLVDDDWYERGFQDGGTWCTFRTDWEVH